MHSRPSIVGSPNLPAVYRPPHLFFCRREGRPLRVDDNTCGREQEYRHDRSTSQTSRKERKKKGLLKHIVPTRQTGYPSETVPLHSDIWIDSLKFHVARDRDWIGEWQGPIYVQSGDRCETTTTSYTITETVRQSDIHRIVVSGTTKEDKGYT